MGLTRSEEACLRTALAFVVIHRRRSYRRDNNNKNIKKRLNDENDSDNSKRHRGNGDWLVLPPANHAPLSCLSSLWRLILSSAAERRQSLLTHLACQLNQSRPDAWQKLFHTTLREATRDNVRVWNEVLPRLSLHQLQAVWDFLTTTNNVFEPWSVTETCARLLPVQVTVPALIQQQEEQNHNPSAAAAAQYVASNNSGRAWLKHVALYHDLLPRCLAAAGD